MSIDLILSASMPAAAYGVDPLTVAEIDGMAGCNRIWRTIDALKTHFDTIEEERTEDLEGERKDLHTGVTDLVESVREAFNTFHRTGANKDLVLVDKALQQLEQHLEE